MIQSKNQGGSNLVFKTAHHIVSQSGFYARDFLSNVLINEVFQPRHIELEFIQIKRPVLFQSTVKSQM